MRFNVKFNLFKHLPECNLSKKLKYQYVQKSSGMSTFEELQDGKELYIIIKDPDTKIKLRAIDDQGVEQVFCINGINNENALKYLKAEWIVQNEGDKTIKRWELFVKSDPASATSVDLTLLDGYKLDVQITYEMDSDPGHVLCQKGNGKSLIALGPTEMDKNKKNVPSQIFGVNEGDIIYIMKVKNTDTVVSYLIPQKLDGEVFYPAIEEHMHILYLLKMDDRYCSCMYQPQNKEDKEKVNGKVAPFIVFSIWDDNPKKKF